MPPHSKLWFLAMQFLRAINRNAEIISNEMSAGVHLPYARHVNDFTIETRDGLLMQFIKLRGLLFETSETSEINYRKTLRDAMLRSFGSSRYAIYHHVMRRQVEFDDNSEFPDDFSRELNQIWGNRLGAKKLFVNDIILTLVRRPVQGNIGILERVKSAFSKAVSSTDIGLTRELRELDAARDALVSQLAIYEPRNMSVYSTPKGFYSEPLEFLSAIFNGELRPVLLPFQDLGVYLPYRRVSFGEDLIEFGKAGNKKRDFVGIVSIKDYPAHTIPGMLDELLRLPFEMTISQSFGFVDRTSALSQIDLALRRMRSSDDDAMSLRNELARAKDDLASGRVGFGEHHMTISVRSPSIQELNFGIAEVQAVLSDLGAVAVREDLALEPAFWAQFPGNFKYIARRGLISTSNFAGFASLHNFAFGKPFGNHWGDAITLFETTAAGPYHFNFHNGDLGNFTLIGPSGSGKTVVLNFLLAQARKIKPKIVLFDKDRGAEIFIRAMGGNYSRLRPGVPSGLNPLLLPDTPFNRQILIEWVMQLSGVIDNASEIQAIKDAIDTNYSAPISHRRLRYFAELFRGKERPHSKDLWSRLQPWFGDGERAWLFDNELDMINAEQDIFGFDMTAILDDPISRTPAMMILFHKIEEKLDGKPTIIVVDEGWKALDDDVFVSKINDWEKTIRKRNGIIGFATQSAQDALKSKISSSIIEQAATNIFMANPKALSEDYVDGFGLTHHEFEIVKNLPDSAHCFLIKNGKESVVARLNLSGQSDVLRVLSGNETTVRALDSLYDETGNLPKDWLHLLLEKV